MKLLTLETVVEGQFFHKTKVFTKRIEPSIAKHEMRDTVQGVAMQLYLK